MADIADLPNVVILENGDDYENYLLRKGYADLIIEAICEYEGNAEYFNKYVNGMKGQKGKGGTERDYGGEGGRTEALRDLCHGQNNKADYALPVANKLVEKAAQGKKVPPKVATLFLALAGKIGAGKAHAAGEAE
jgi:hypothetical protein